MKLTRPLRFRAAALVCAALLGGALAGCAAPHSETPTWAQAKSDDLLAATARATDSLLAQLNSQTVVPAASLSRPIVVASLQNLSNLDKPAPIGRLLGEAVAARMTQRQLPVVELKLANTIKISEDGQTLLSDQARELAQTHKAQIVVVGSWTEGGRFVYVTLKALRAEDGLALASQSFSMPKDPNVQLLLVAPKKPTTNNGGF